MSESWAHSGGPASAVDDVAPADAAAALSVAAEYGLALVFVALAGLLAFVVEHLVPAPNLTLIFVAPVVVCAVAFGWAAALVAAIASVLAFDFFFTQPYYSLRITSPSDLWATALLLVIAGIVSSVAAQSRRRALQVRQAAEQARALQDLAHLIIARRPEQEILRAAVDALHRAFGAAAVVGLASGRSVKAIAVAGGARLDGPDEEAALGALDTDKATRAGVYPYGESSFDFWPAARNGAAGWVVGVAFRDRPASPDRYVDIVRGYVAAAVRAASSEGA